MSIRVYKTNFEDETELIGYADQAEISDRDSSSPVLYLMGWRPMSPASPVPEPSFPRTVFPSIETAPVPPEERALLTYIALLVKQLGGAVTIHQHELEVVKDAELETAWHKDPDYLVIKMKEN